MYEENYCKSFVYRQADFFDSLLHADVYGGAIILGI